MHGNSVYIHILFNTAEDFYQLRDNISFDEDVDGWVMYSAEDSTCSTGCSDFLVFITTVDAL